MRLFRGRAKPKNDQEDKERMLDADTQAAATAATDVPNAGSEAGPDTAPSDTPEPDAKEAGTAEDAPQQAPPPQDNLLAQIGAEADAELAKEEAAAAEGASPTDKDELDPELLDIFRDARNEVQESSLAAELEDISVQQLLDVLAGVSRRLGVPPRGLMTDLDTDTGEPSNESPDVSEPDDD
jgi:hypothetical protein